MHDVILPVIAQYFAIIEIFCFVEIASCCACTRGPFVCVGLSGDARRYRSASVWPAVRSFGGLTRLPT